MDHFQPLVLASYRYPDGSCYHGEWNLFGLKHGYGVMLFSEGEIYRGKFENNYFSGVGYLRLKDGSFYVGQFMAGWFHGQGIFQSIEGHRYVGYFRAGKIFGLGQATFAGKTAAQLEGEFKEGKHIDIADCSSIINNVTKMCRLFRIDSVQSILESSFS